MPQEKRSEYVVVEDHAMYVEYRLNELAAEGYQVIAVTPGSTDDRGLMRTVWTLRLRAQLCPPPLPVNQPLLSQLALATVTIEEKWEKLRAHVYESIEGFDRTLSVLVRRLEALEALEAKFDHLRTGLDGVLSVVVRRLEALEAWRLETESELAQGVCSGEDCGAIQQDEDEEADVRWLPGAGIALPRATEPDVDATKANGRVRRGENAPE